MALIEVRFGVVSVNADRNCQPYNRIQRVADAAPNIMGILFYFGIFYLAGLAQWMVWKRITREVNQHLPDSEQYPTSVLAFSPRSSQSPINQFKIWQLHRQFFRNSYLRWLYLATLALMILFLGLCVQFDRSHSIAHSGAVVVTPPSPTAGGKSQLV